MTDRFHPFSLNLGGRLAEFSRPAVMGIINATPDSFHAGSRAGSCRAVAEAVERMIEEGVDIIDVGACSTRPRSAGEAITGEADELERLRMALPVVREIDTRIPVSVDTFRASVARVAVEELGADIVNDVGCCADPLMADTVAALRVPYVLTHSLSIPPTPSPADMGAPGVTAAVIARLSEVWRRLRLLGVADIIIDPGFGFDKSVADGYRLLRDLPALAAAFAGAPILVGVSRKSMVTRPLAIGPADALAPTVALETVALMQGASIVRAHDVAAARRAAAVVGMLHGHTY